jgi:hypothetical protein
MSPAGISMFYGSSDKCTCIEEVKTLKNSKFTLAKWNATRDLELINLCAFKKGKLWGEWYYEQGTPSIFDENNRDKI